MKKLALLGLVAVSGLAAANTPLPDFSPVAQGQHVVINIPQMRLFLYENGRLKNAYPVAVGKNRTRTPLGNYQIGSKAYNPTWTIPASIRRERAASGLPDIASIPPGPSNPLGPVFVRLGPPRLGLGIHGTNAPASVPGIRSHGCVRMHSNNALQFARSVHTGANAAVIYQLASLNADANNNLWLAAYSDPYQQRNLNTAALRQSITAWAQAKGLTANESRINAALRSRNGRPVCITCRPGQTKVQGQLQSLAWQDGSGELSRPQAVEIQAPQQPDEILPEGSAVEALTDGAGSTETPIPASNPAPRRRSTAAEPRERPLPATPVQPQDIPLSDTLL
ncbi:L,D-transpeptidase family protein [Eikenella sp. S3360]|uniref:L,D-transpeptidase family protein n=1 Tax=Eikenella glucosivorans TaxID=2766967 RepID=A0ABS0N927_9NEIS|nr:L,D-transpeptidase [Eikenella glucosivorans]MBH5328775.1 L,D-transpeptidase family protein [Eikenella glucosivorans]